VTLPAVHPMRVELSDEVHARPPLPLAPPSRVTCLALVSPPAARADEWSGLLALAARFGVALPATPGSHCSADFGAFRLKWERHTEFSRYVFVVDGASDAPFASPAIASLPPDWVAALPGQVIYAAHCEIVRDAAADYDALAARHFGGNPLVGSAIGGGVALALTDFRIAADGFSRILVIDRGMTPFQGGRAVQSLLEIDAYRVLALLAFPMARDLSPAIYRNERELAEVANVLVRAEVDSEPVLLDRLTRLQAEIERHEADNHYRFGAAVAYYEIVQRRIAMLREERLPPLQTFQEFTERRLAPAMNTCAAVSARLESLSQRVTRATQLLSTRIEITRERQNQQLLASMNRRAEMQLRLQGTVEGLSVAAVTYYVVGLVNYGAKGLPLERLGADPGVVTALAIPVVALLVALGVRRIRHMVAEADA
jgi:uncharacterized membrane-anchored protein